MICKHCKKPIEFDQIRSLAMDKDVYSHMHDHLSHCFDEDTLSCLHTVAAPIPCECGHSLGIHMKMAVGYHCGSVGCNCTHDPYR